jgi:hypothetical protein
MPDNPYAATIGSPKPPHTGRDSRGAGSFQVPSALIAALGSNIKIIAGYIGAPKMHAAHGEKRDRRSLRFLFCHQGVSFSAGGI